MPSASPAKIASHVVGGRVTRFTRSAAAMTRTIEGSAVTYADSNLVVTYATGGSGVTWSWRVQPFARSIATRTAAESEAPIAPYAAIETMTNALAAGSGA